LLLTQLQRFTILSYLAYAREDYTY
jgi:hypothetical protein